MDVWDRVKPGDKIRIIRGSPPYFYKGDIGRVILAENSWALVAFNGNGNPKVYRSGEFHLYRYKDYFEILKENTQHYKVSARIRGEGVKERSVTPCVVHAETFADAIRKIAEEVAKAVEGNDSYRLGEIHIGVEHLPILKD